MKRHNLVLGIDFGSDSARVVLMDAADGKQLAEASCSYPRWMEGKYSDPSKAMFRQHPLDYLEAMEISVCKVTENIDNDLRACIRAISVDTTGSTPCPVDEKGIPLALYEEYAEDPNAMFYMWKDHTSVKEAALINQVLSDYQSMDFTKYQGNYSSEWWWAKILHAKNVAPYICEHAASWIEHSDWIPFVLTGGTRIEQIKRNACGAGHKALWHSSFHGLPSLEALSKLDPYLAEVAKTYGKPSNAGTVVGNLSKEWADKWKLDTDIVVAVGSFDAHAGAVGAGIRPGTLVEVVGTSTVSMMISSSKDLKGKDLHDLCGQAENSIIPGYIGIETSQAAFGDLFSWYRKLMMWPVKDFISTVPELSEERKQELLYQYDENLLDQMSKIIMKENAGSELVALDWMNGRRYPVTNDAIRGSMNGISLGTTAPQIYEAISLGAVFGAKRIIDLLATNGVAAEDIVAVGGIAKKSPYIMQLMADVLGIPIKVSRSTQCCAIGAAIYAAVGAGIYQDVLTASEQMSEGVEKVYQPQKEKEERFNRLYAQYLSLCKHTDEMFFENMKQ